MPKQKSALYLLLVPTIVGLMCSPTMATGTSDSVNGGNAERTELLTRSEEAQRQAVLDKLKAHVPPKPTSENLAGVLDALLPGIGTYVAKGDAQEGFATLRMGLILDGLALGLAWALASNDKANDHRPYYFGALAASHAVLGVSTAIEVKDHNKREHEAYVAEDLELDAALRKFDTVIRERHESIEKAGQLAASGNLEAAVSHLRSQNGSPAVDRLLELYESKLAETQAQRQAAEARHLREVLSSAEKLAARKAYLEACALLEKELKNSSAPETLEARIRQYRSQGVTAALVNIENQIKKAQFDTALRDLLDLKARFPDDARIQSKVRRVEQEKAKNEGRARSEATTRKVDRAREAPIGRPDVASARAEAFKWAKQGMPSLAFEALGGANYRAGELNWIWAAFEDVRKLWSPIKIKRGHPLVLGGPVMQRTPEGYMVRCWDGPFVMFRTRRDMGLEHGHVIVALGHYDGTHTFTNMAGFKKTVPAVKLLSVIRDLTAANELP